VTYRESLLRRSFNSAIFGVIAGVLIVVLHSLIDFGDLLFNPTPGARWSQLAMLAAGGGGGALIGALVPILEDRPVALLSIIPVAGALAGAIYWYFLQPEEGPLAYVIIGLVIAIVFALVGWLQSR